MSQKIAVVIKIRQIYSRNEGDSQSQWPRGLRRSSVTPRLLRLWVRIQPGAWMCVCCECCVLSEESYRLRCVNVCDLQNLVTEEALAHWGLLRPPKKGGEIKERNCGSYFNLVPIITRR